MRTAGDPLEAWLSACKTANQAAEELRLEIRRAGSVDELIERARTSIDPDDRSAAAAILGALSRRFAALYQAEEQEAAAARSSPP